MRLGLSLALSFSLAAGLLPAVAQVALPLPKPIGGVGLPLAVPPPAPIATAPAVPSAADAPAEEGPSAAALAFPSGTGAPAEKIAVTATAPAKVLFGQAATPANLATRSIGFYAKGCLAGAVALPISGETWQVMRLSRNRNWGHPALIAMLERLAADAPRLGWPGLLVGDISQPRGGPMITGHASHQIGLDADIWLTPMPDHRLSAEERETMVPVSMLKEGTLELDESAWSSARARLIKRAASDPKVERIFVHPAIKRKLCQWAGADRAWLGKVRPFWGHYYHFHVRIACPAGMASCRAQAPVPPGDGCGKPVDDWLAMMARPPPPPPKVEKPPPPPMTLAALPAECRTVLLAK